MSIQKNSLKELLNISVIVASLGYFVDIYDLLIFLVVKTNSLTDIGVMDADITSAYSYILNYQMGGMLLGGILWGILGDKKGRLSVLFGSIALYSIANFANAFVHNVELYAFLRFISGVGLAGELGAGVTQVSEVLSKENRGLGTMLIASIGVMGAIFAGIIAEYFDWRVCYMIGGGLGFSLLLLRIGVAESGMFAKAKEIEHVKKGDFLSLFTQKKRFIKYMKCILVGLPIWYVVAILVGLANKFAIEFGSPDTVKDNYAVLFCYAGLTVGDTLAGLISQLLKSRKKTLFIFITLTFILIVAFLNLDLFAVNSTVIYTMCGLLGLAVGYWAIFITVGAEQFGTNIRATVTTTIPNFVRGSTVPIMILFKFLFDDLSFSLSKSALIVGIICTVIAFLALRGMEETFGKDLDYIEEK